MTKGQRAFIFGWSGLLILTSALLFFLLTSQQIQRRQAAAARHAARMTQDDGCPKAAAGQAPADVVNVGVYVDRVPEVSFVTSGWKADFFVWFSWDETCRTLAIPFASSTANCCHAPLLGRSTMADTTTRGTR